MGNEITFRSRGRADGKRILNASTFSLPLCRPYSMPSLRKGLRKLTFASILSRNSTGSQRTLCRTSRITREVDENSLLCKRCASVWPVPRNQAIFMPDFKLSNSSFTSHFLVEGLISKGAFGEVYRVFKKEENERFAVKVLKKSKIVCEGCITQVKNEVKIQIMCGHHPFIVNLVNYFQTKRSLVLVLEYLPGGDLYDFCIRHGPLSEDLTKIYIAQVAISIDFLHNAGVVMRDLKPENILIDSSFSLKLTDFGLAKWLKYGERTSTICGTLGYMAPEVMSGKEPYSHSVDWWSLGVLAWFLLTLEVFGIGSIDLADSEVENCEFEFAKTVDDVTSPNEASCIQKNPLPRTFEDSGLSLAATDVLKRLLVHNPDLRLKSLLSLSKIPFYHGLNIESIKSKQVNFQHLVKRQLEIENEDLSKSQFAFMSEKSMGPLQIL